MVVDPLLRLRQDLQQPSDAPIMTYTTDMADPQPLRIVVDDEFTGDAWQPTVVRCRRTSSPRTASRDPEGLTAKDVQRPEHTTTDQGGQPRRRATCRCRTLDVGQPARQLVLRRLHPHRGRGRLTDEGAQYTVDHFTVEPRPRSCATRRGAARRSSSGTPSLPPGTDPEIRQIARAQAGAGHAYDQAVALRDWLRTVRVLVQAPATATDDSSRTRSCSS